MMKILKRKSNNKGYRKILHARIKLNMTTYTFSNGHHKLKRN